MSIFETLIINYFYNKLFKNFIVRLILKEVLLI